MSELAGLRFCWRHYSLPRGLTLTDRDAFLVNVESSEHLDELVKFFEDIYVTLQTTRNVYRFRSDES